MLLLSPRARCALISTSASDLPLLLSCWPCISGQQSAHEGGRTYRVVDVEHDDVLNIRAGPSVGYPIVGEIPPGGRGVRLLGHCRGWCPVSYNGASGWVNGYYLAAEPAVAGYVRGVCRRRSRVTPRPRKRAQLPPYWRVTGVAEGESLKVHDGPSPSAQVVHAFEPQSGCIKARRRLPETVVPGEVSGPQRRPGRLGGFQEPGARQLRLPQIGATRPWRVLDTTRRRIGVGLRSACP